MKIHFAHRTFPWESEARGKAHVHVVIIGFGALRMTGKSRLSDYEADANIRLIARSATSILTWLTGQYAVLLRIGRNRFAGCRKLIRQYGNDKPNDGRAI